MKTKIFLGTLLSGLITTSCFASVTAASVTALGDQNLDYFIKQMEINASGPTPTSGIEPGKGYSSDTQNIAPAVCYAPTSVTRGSQSGSINVTSNMKVEQIASAFGLQVSLNGGYGAFAANGMTSYLRSMQEDLYSFSLNYYQKIAASVHTDYSYYQPTLFSEQGRNIYSNGQNQLFRIICGDTLVTDYDEGAGLIMTIKITFKSKMEKEEFLAKAGANFGSYLNATAAISQIANRYNLDGAIDISGYQLGGDPTQLSKMLSNHIAECDIKNVTACQQTAQAVINYATNDFPRQFNINGGIWTGPLIPLGGFTAIYTLPDIGIPLPPTYVTPEVKAARATLAKKKIDNTAYFENLSQLVPPNDEQIYPVALDANFKSQLRGALVNSSANSTLFDQENTQAIRCWLMPAQCPAIASSIISQLMPVVLPANFDEVFSHVRVSPPNSMYGAFWPTGAGYCSDRNNCKVYYQEYTPIELRGGFALVSSDYAMATADDFAAHGVFHDGGDCPYYAAYSIAGQTIRLQSGGCAGHDRVGPYVLEMKDNPFYFRINRP